MSPSLYPIVPLIRRNGHPMFNRRSFWSTFTLRQRIETLSKHKRLQFLPPGNPLNHNQIGHFRVLLLGIIGSLRHEHVTSMWRKHQERKSRWITYV